MKNGQDSKMLIRQIGGRIQTICRKKGISYQELADKSNISTAVLYRIISGNANPQLSTLQMLADALDITLVELVGGQRQAFDQKVSKQKIIERIEKLSDQKRKLLWEFLVVLTEG